MTILASFSEILGATGWPFFLVLLGLLLLLLEVYVPSGGVIGFISAALVILSVILAFRNGNEIGVRWLGWAFLLAVIFAVPTILGLGFKTLPHTRLGKKLIIDGAPVDQARSGVDDLAHLVGQEGEAISDLRPAGVARLSGQRHDVTTCGGFIDQGCKVVVDHVEGNRIFVRPAEGP
jgi:membrane-bound ClpP family serine protease